MYLIKHKIDSKFLKKTIHNDIICPNYIICNNIIRENDIYNPDGLCLDCHLLFGKWRNKDGILRLKDKLEPKENCPVCDDKIQNIFRPSCNHFICINCFKKLYFGIELKKPLFPYIDKEVEYWFNIENKNINEWMICEDIKEYINNLERWNKLKDIYLRINSRCFECFE